ncbi:hypothetical protein ACFUOZ_03455 [Paenarthrobacter sp. NPDC057355]|uniref:hypothetical protein n=1 Tax=Paenarthrobacter sp. NPDC057355 TaxID=3346105 RepID=UPI0036362903
MPADSTFYAPLQYQGLWMWLGVLLLVLVAGWYGWLLLPRRAPVDAHRTSIPTEVETLRSRCLAAIEDTVADADAGRVPEREAHQRLSFLVREFAGAVTGLPVTSMTLDELRGEGLDGLAEGMAGIYPSEFSARHVRPVRHSADLARQVVRAWN